MSIQSSIMKASARSQQKLFDQAVHTTGREVDCMKISYVEDIFQNTEEEAILSYEDIIARVNYPTEIPIDRFRLDGTLEVAETRTYFFDVLPIEVFTKFEHGLEKDDYLFHFFEDEKKNKIPMLLQVTETFGKLTTDLIWRKYYCAPQSRSVPTEVIALIKDRFNI